MASLIDSPLYRRKSAADWSRQQGERGGMFWKNAKTGEEKYQEQNPGGEGGSAPQSAADDAQKKLEGYASQLREKFGNDALAKIDAMATDLKGKPGSEAKVEALGKVRAMLGEKKPEAAKPAAEPPKSGLHEHGKNRHGQDSRLAS